jgi:hypothetical protein
MIDFDALLNVPVAGAFGQKVIIRHKAGAISTVEKFDFRQGAAPEDGGGEAEFQAFEFTGGFRKEEAPQTKHGDFVDVAGATYTVAAIDPDDTGWITVGLMAGEVRNV